MKTEIKMYPTKSYPSTRKESGNFGDEGIDYAFFESPFAEGERQDVTSPNEHVEEEDLGDVELITEATLIEDEKILRAFRNEIATGNRAFLEEHRALIRRLEGKYANLKNRLDSHRSRRMTQTDLPDQLRSALENFHGEVRSLLAESAQWSFDRYS
ncbi:MAG: hypothetical protein HY961_10115 [Ignavibacteriae bacterium]|nr:hypothetical protein [Ignavibacteriota bacterium]